MDIRLALITGVDIPIPECQITAHQPSIKEIAMIGEESQLKLQETMQKIVNDSNGGMVCIII